MKVGLGPDVDLIEELRLRRWARENYVPRSLRQTTWHPVVLDEMEKKETDLSKSNPVFASKA
jgi:hypothetical protein